MNFHLDEALLEPVARWWRFQMGIKYMPISKKMVVADLGCGPEIRFWRFCQKKHLEIKQYYGVDPLIDLQKKKQLEKNSKITIVTQPLVKKINLPSQSVDAVVGFAFLEHIDYPQEVLRDAVRILKSGGVLIFTTPSYRAKPILEFLAFKLGVISPREIAEHQRYFSKEDLLKLLPPALNSNQIFHRYFEWGMNNLVVVKK